MFQPLKYYQKNQLKYGNRVDQLKKKIGLSSMVRLGVFVVFSLLAYLFFQTTYIFASVIILGLVLFSLLVLHHQKLVYDKKLSQHFYDINSVEIEYLNGSLTALADGAEFVDHSHYYSNDIDLYGKGSFFHHLNRTTTQSGRLALSKTLAANDIHNILKRQLAIAELAEHPNWRQRFTALSKMVSLEIRNEVILSWIKEFLPFLPSGFKYIPYLFSICSAVIIVLIAMGSVSFVFLVVWFFLGLGITFPYIQRVNQVYQKSDKAKNTFKQYHKLLKEIESLNVTSDQLKDAQSKIKTEQKKASEIFKEFSKILDAFDQRNNMLFGIIGNGLLLWDLHQSKKIETWIGKYRAQVESWFEVIAFYDAQISLSNFAFNHPQYAYPQLSKSELIVRATALGHPLISEKVRIDNDFQIKDKEFLIITGANMAGKSTFLRTVSLSIVMANSGLPVCATSFEYKPIRLISSMRTSDSLVEDSSYFHAEITRLKFIVDQMDTEKYFIILDEILKGTNSKDKAVGSRKFVEKLVRSGSTGIIATHDLSLCDIANKYTQIHNKHFDALIQDQELLFDYALKDGICVNMNASFLLKKMKIV